ncbi:MAG: DUF5309 family protein [bacterium]
MANIIDLMQTYDQSDTNDYSIADGIHSISPVESLFQRMLPKVPASAIKHEWIEDALIERRSTTAATIANTTDVTFDVAAGDGALVFPDAANVDTTIRVDQEVMLVTGRATDTLTITRGYGSTTKSTHAAGAKIIVISQHEHEGADGKTAIAQARTRPANYLQTLSRTVEVTGVQEAVAKLGGVDSEMNYEIVKAMKELANELEDTIINGVLGQVGNGSSTYRTMGGLWAMISTNRNSSSGHISEEVIEADLKTIWEAGGIASVIVTSGAIAQQITDIYENRVRQDTLFQLGGANITAIVNPLSMGAIAVIPHRFLSCEYYMLDTSKIALGYLRPFFMKDLADDGDADKRWIGGDYTLQLMNEKAHAYRYGFTE